ncbi:YgjV family protein [Sediminicurvatus halobius]|uniref:YgjV family protein n=1 Tax=Sediminicurvatus halobius TaxID=2182432 RepID=A0A2U2N5S4_9GAMM|nr:YgjV family protein [Spiribacter halobius]PWG64408.1 hypothetical protein DEM34_05610 [Spiribacter halobius]UEX79296.1 YgjV family protein [Spiribacter halobius]
MTLSWLAGQLLGLTALTLCVAAFASRRDDRLMVLLISANVAFALHFLCFGSTTAAALTALIVLRICLARRYKGSVAVMAALLMASAAAAALTWQSPLDLLPLTAAVLGTIGMFLLRGIPMRLLLAAAALAWTLNNILIGSIGGTLAELLVLATNLVTMLRLAREREAAPAGALREARS